MMATCPSCGDCFDTEGGMKKHHYHKHGESVATDTTTCVECSSTFEYYPSDKEGIYCSDCADNSWGDENLIRGSGEKNTNWRGGSTQTECDNCGNEIDVRRWNNETYENNFCSTECLSSFRSSQYEGKSNPRYIDGESRQRRYGSGWRTARKEALNRDGFECRVCGKGREQIGRNPSVHHKKPVREFDDPQDAHYLENLITLCPKHHQQVEAGNRKI